MKQYNCLSNSMTIHIKFQVPSSKWYYKYPYNNIRKPNKRVCPSWLNLLHNRNSHLKTLGGSVSFQCVINIFSLFIYKLHQQLPTPSNTKLQRLWDSLFDGSLNQELINASSGGKNDGGISTITKKKMMVERNLKFSKTYVSRKVPCSFSLVVLYIIIASC
jgi:hypothetical protein